MRWFPRSCKIWPPSSQLRPEPPFTAAPTPAGATSEPEPKPGLREDLRWNRNELERVTERGNQTQTLSTISGSEFCLRSLLDNSQPGVKIEFYWQINEREEIDVNIRILVKYTTFREKFQEKSSGRKLLQVSAGEWVVDLVSSWWRWTLKWPKCCTFVKEIVFVSRAGTISLKQKFSIATERWAVSIFISTFLHSKWDASSYRRQPGGWHFMGTR